MLKTQIMGVSLALRCLEVLDLQETWPANVKKSAAILLSTENIKDMGLILTPCQGYLGDSNLEP